MKKNFYFFVVLIIILVISCDDIYAKEKGEQYFFDYSSNYDALFTALCNSFVNCSVQCGGQTYTGNADTVKGMCENNVEKFTIARKYKNFSEFRDEIQNIDCEGQTCFNFVKNKYCKNKPNDKICKKLNSEKNNAVVTDNGVSCPINFTPYLKQKEYVINFGYKPSENKLYPSFTNSETSKFFIIERDDNYMYGLDQKFNFYSKGSDYKTDSKKFIDYIKNSDGKCPKAKFCLENINQIDGYYVWWLEMESCDTSKYSGIEQDIYQGADSGTKLTKSKTDWGNKLFKDKNMLTISSCKELLGGENSTELVDLLKNIVTVVKVLIPLILISLGTLDFAKAVFSNEDTMKKCQKKFIQRIIIAIVIFLIPSLLKVLLTLANSAWGNISSDLCGIL